MKQITGYSVYVNTAYYETYELLSDARSEANKYNAFNDVEILPMMAKEQ